MSILGVVVRTHAHQAAALGRRLAAQSGVELVADPGDGRCVIVIEDGAADAGSPGTSAAATLAGIAQWPEVLNTSLVYEYSGPDSPGPPEATHSYTQWRDGLRPAGAAEPKGSP